jgi:hypothetical protein
MESTCVVYLIACYSEFVSYIKIGKTTNLKQRMRDIQTGCPLEIKQIYAILSEFELEVIGLEQLLHKLLKSNRLRGEWYFGTPEFFLALESVLTRINQGGFSREEIEKLPSFQAPLDMIEIMMHHHDFKFKTISPLKLKNADFSALTDIEPSEIATNIKLGLHEMHTSV